jgi:hypothetical protein
VTGAIYFTSQAVGYITGEVQPDIEEQNKKEENEGED